MELSVLFLSLFLSASEIWHGVLSQNKNKIWGETNLGDPPATWEVNVNSLKCVYVSFGFQNVYMKPITVTSMLLILIWLILLNNLLLLINLFWQNVTVN